VAVLCTQKIRIATINAEIAELAESMIPALCGLSKLCVVASTERLFCTQKIRITTINAEIAELAESMIAALCGLSMPLRCFLRQ
jgi:hypothetical protein